ncbi:hypothetical protein H4R34_000248 [Dimargaris verticillata]|uniref:Pentatricopeptide repeat-containing protein-mitochondrial domain-containing protein n=1 Tax=Dimargaris verticillata TaxID=2761393 RepID=A0A9W8BD01_9FUNG|nr:hypothetical protein H4R34_000248 [Dimargaris verticillata]
MASQTQARCLRALARAGHTLHRAARMQWPRSATADRSHVMVSALCAIRTVCTSTPPQYLPSYIASSLYEPPNAREFAELDEVEVEKEIQSLLSEQGHNQSASLASSTAPDPMTLQQRTLPWYNLALDRLMERRDFRGIFAKCQEMTQRGIAPNGETYLYYFAACKFTGQFQRAFRGLEQLLNHGLPTNIAHYHAVMEIALRRQYSYGCQKVYDLMVQHGTKPTALTYQFLIGTLCQENQVELAHRLWNILQNDRIKPTPTTSQLLIVALARTQAPQEAFAILLTCEENNVAIAASTYMALFRVAADRYHMDATIHTWKKVVDVFRLQPTQGDCLLALRATATKGRPDLASDVIRIMNLYQYECGAPHLDHLFTSFVRVSDWKSALNVLELLREAGHDVTRTILQPLERRLLRIPKSIPVVLDMVRELQLEGKPPFLAVLNTLMSVATRHGSVRDAVSFLRRFSSEFHVDPNRDTYHIMLEGCLSTKDSEMAHDLFSEMKQAGGELAPDTKTYTKMIITVANQPNYEDAFVLLEEMKKLNLVPTSAIYTTIIRSCLKAGDSRAKLALKEMELFGYPPSAQLLDKVNASFPAEA